MGRKRVVILAGRSFTGTHVASGLLRSGKEVAAIVVETDPPSSSQKEKGESRLRKLFWYLRTGQFSELLNRFGSFLWKSPYEWTHALHRRREIIAARAKSFLSPAVYPKRRKQGTYFFFEDLAKLYHVPVLSVSNLNDPDSVLKIQRFSPDLLVICGTRKLKPEVLHSAPSGALNIHGSLLPKYRGLSAEFWALFHGDHDAVGVTVHYADSGLDTGDIVLQRKTEVTAKDTFRTLRFKNTKAGGELMVEALNRIEEGTVQRTPQPKEGYPTYRQPSFLDRQNLFQRRSFPMFFILLSLVFLASFLLRIASASSRGAWELTGDEVSYDAAAVHLVSGKGYLTQGTNSRPPGYPFFLMIHYLLFGHRLWPVWITQAILGSLTVLLGWDIARRRLRGWGLSLAVLLMMVEPALRISSCRLFLECLSLFLLMLSIWLFQYVREKGTVTDSVALGVISGFLVLTRGMMVFFPLFLLFGLGGMGRYREWGRVMLLTLFSFFLTVAPWVLRNARVYGRPLLNTPQAGDVFYFASKPLEGKRFGLRHEDETTRFAASHFSSDLQRDSFLFKQGLKNMFKTPWTPLRLLALKFLMFWSPFDWELFGGGRYNGVYGFFLPFSLVGMAGWIRKMKQSWELFAPILYSLGMALVFYGSPRFRMSVHPFLILFAVLALTALAEKCQRRATPFFLGVAGFFFVNMAMAAYSESVRIVVRDALRWMGVWT